LEKYFIKYHELSFHAKLETMAYTIILVTTSVKYMSNERTQLVGLIL